MLVNRFPAIVLVLCTAFLVIACNGDYTPKPRAFFRIELPEKEYHPWKGGGCPFTFEIPDYSVMASYRDSIAEPCWKYLVYPRFRAELFLSYKPVEDNLDEFLEDTRELVYKHVVKADAIDEVFVSVPSENVYGLVYDIGGSAASSVQFFITDSTDHFMRGALYFNAAPQPDSLAPVVEFIREDIIRLIRTTRWQGK